MLSIPTLFRNAFVFCTWKMYWNKRLEFSSFIALKMDLDKL